MILALAAALTYAPQSAALTYAPRLAALTYAPRLVALTYAPRLATLTYAPRLVGYYSYTDQWESPAYTSAQIPFDELTHVIHDGVRVAGDGSGTITLPYGFLEPALLTGAHAAGDKVILNVSGGADAFARVSRSATARRAFAANARRLVRKYGYDGLDIDWEAPAKADETNCTAFFQALRDALPASSYSLSLAISSHPQERYGGQGFDVPALAKFVDFFNVMSYDFTGTYGRETGHNSPLLQSPNDPLQVGSLATGMQRFTQTYGVSPMQLNIGTAFSGYAFTGYGALWQSCNGSCGNAAAYINYAQVKTLVGKDGWSAYRDRTAGGAPYLIALASNEFITYDDTRSTTDKVDYVIGKQHFGGMFMWELSLDYDGRSQDLLTAMASEYQVLAYGSR
jgi:chitinase